MAETLGIRLTFQNGVTFSLKSDQNNILYVSMTGGPLAPVLQALNVESLDLPSDAQDIQKLQQLLGLGVQVFRATRSI